MARQECNYLDDDGFISVSSSNGTYGTITKTGKNIVVNLMNWNGSLASGATIYTLPDGYKPKTACYGVGLYTKYNSQNVAGAATFPIDTNGDIKTNAPINNFTISATFFTI